MPLRTSLDGGPSARTGAGELTGVALLGATGSIGRQALDVLDELSDTFRVVAMAAGSDVDTFSAQVAHHRPNVAWLADEAAAERFRPPAGVSVERSDEPLVALATRDDVDLVLVGTGGVVSLPAVLAALRAGKVVATANKETLVTAGHLVMPLARRAAAEAAVPGGEGRLRPTGAADALAWLRPIDSEHSAIWQCLAGEDTGDMRTLLITGSGGPFRTTPLDGLRTVRPADALAHPTWRMGGKVTVDSATLMNKGLEVIEAHWLYDVAYDRIDVLIHPQSIVHSLVEFVDGSLKAQLGLPDMHVPIRYALTFPRHSPATGPRLDLVDVAALTFEAPDEERFPALRVARAAGAAGPRATAALIAADEVAVDRFLEGSLDFLGITALVERAVERFGDSRLPHPDLEEVLALDAEVRAYCASVPGASA